MSQSDNQISEVVGGDDEEVGVVGGGGGGGGGCAGCGGVHGNDKEKRQRGFVFTRNFRRAKQVVLSSLPNAKKKRKQQKPHQIKTLSSSSSSSSAANASLSGCCFCFKQPHTLDSPVESQSSDPNDLKSSYGMLKSLIEQNDFYSKESNPHLDFHPDYNLP